MEPGVDVHVLEVGNGYPVYLQHGAPTSGFLYRKIAELLPPDQFRLIMPTMVGLGFSTQVPAEQHTADNHVRWMNEVLNRLPSVMAAFPNAPVTETDSGHFLQEEVDSPEAIAAAIQRVLAQIQES